MPKSKTQKPKTWPTFSWQGLIPQPVIGVDEVGRGCLAGPVFAAAVVLPPPGPGLYQDSKILSELRREVLSAEIQKHYPSAIGIASVEEIAELNILWASLLAMKRAIVALGLESGHVLVDGKIRIPDLSEGFIQTPVIKGDLRAEPISAASIVAKVARDRFMVELSKKHAGYGFEVHKGYPTPAHKRALAILGPSHVHRRSFRGVAELL